MTPLDAACAVVKAGAEEAAAPGDGTANSGTANSVTANSANEDDVTVNIVEYSADGSRTVLQQYLVPFWKRCLAGLTRLRSSFAPLLARFLASWQRALRASSLHENPLISR